MPIEMARRPGAGSQRLVRLGAFATLAGSLIYVVINTALAWTYVFHLEEGVKFHDGSPFNADAVVWNVDKVLKQDAVQFDPSQVGVTASRMPTLASARKIDEMTARTIRGIRRLAGSGLGRSKDGRRRRTLRSLAK